MKAKFWDKMKTFALFSTNKIRKKVKFSAKNFFFQRCEIFAKRFSDFAGTPSRRRFIVTLESHLNSLIKATPVLYFFNFLVKDETNIFPN